jgi:hypothetical protein
MSAGRVVWAALELLDRQLVDPDRMPCAKVDDLEFDWTEGELPVLTDILTGPAALAYRLNHRLARALELLRRVADPRPEPGPNRISWGIVVDIGTELRLAVDRHELAVTSVENWLATHVVARIPGSGVPKADG